MKSLFILTVLLEIAFTPLVQAQKQLDIYSDAEKLATGTWAGEGILIEHDNGTGPDGKWVYQFDYSFTNWWAGFGLNLNNWGQSPALDFSSYDSLHIGFWITSINSSISLAFQDRIFYRDNDPNHRGKTVDIPVSDHSGYIEKTIPLSAFKDAQFDWEQIVELDVNILPNTASDMGQLYLDYIRLSGPVQGLGPSIHWLLPKRDTTLHDLSGISLEWGTGHPKGDSLNIEVYVNDQHYYTLDRPPYQLNFLPWDNGIYNIKASATDLSGNKVFTSSRIITVKGAPPLNTASINRAATLHKGVNLAGWMEAFWHILYNTPGEYMETGAYSFEELKFFKTMGIETIRFPVLLEWYHPSHPHYSDIDIPKALEHMDSIVSWTSQLGLHLILVNHHGIELTDENWRSMIDFSFSAWKPFLLRYEMVDSDDLFFELKNEPHFISSKHLRIFTQMLLEKARKIDPDRTWIVGGTGYNGAEDLYRWLPYNDRNIIYTYHNYQPFCFVNQLYDPDLSDNEPPICNEVVQFPMDKNNPIEINALNQTHGTVKDWSQHYAAPVFCGEFGVNVYADARSRCNYFTTMGEILNNLEIPWTYWDPRSADIMGETSGYGWFHEGKIDCQHLADSCIYLGLGLKWDCNTTNTRQRMPPSREWKIIPNPARDQVYIKGLLPQDGSIPYSILDITGREVESGSSNTGILSIAGLKPGFYLVYLPTQSHQLKGFVVER